MSKASDDLEGVRYGLLAQGPAPERGEVEEAREVTEVTVLWGELSVLHVAHLEAGGRFVVGDGSDEEGGLDYVLADSTLGAPRVVLVEHHASGPVLAIPAGAKGDAEAEGALSDFAALEQAGRLRIGEDGVRRYALPSGVSVRLDLGPLRFLVKRVAAGKKVAGRGAKGDRKGLAWIAASLAVHGVFLVMIYFMPPQGSALALGDIHRESRLPDYLITQREMEQEEPELEALTPSPESNSESGKRHADAEGQAGDERAPRTRNHFSIEGPRDNPTVQLAREVAREQARTAGILGVLRAASPNLDVLRSEYGADVAIGRDAANYLGAIMGDHAGANFGLGGVGFVGTGRGAGGDGLGTAGQGELGTINRGNGTCVGPDCGYGRRGGVVGDGTRRPRVPPATTRSIVTTAGYPREAIRRTIQLNSNQVRACYEQGLSTRADLEGRVTVSFIIRPDGAVQSSAVDAARTTLGDARTETCVANAVRRWSFEAPAQSGMGAVGVTYPFMLQTQ